MTSLDRAPDDPPETSSLAESSSASASATASPSATHTHTQWTAPGPSSSSSLSDITGVSPTTISAPLPVRHRPTQSFPSQLMVATGADVLDPSTSPGRPLFSISPSQITPLESNLPLTPSSKTSAAPSSSGHPRSPRRKAADMGPSSAIDHQHPGIPFPDDDNDSMSGHFEGPSSAPPTPSVISVTHPSPFIHTHHPRRGSLTPLGLNVISPVPPPQVQSLEGSPGFPIRSFGFNAAGGSDGQSDPSRRDSVASVASNLTATRPSTYAMNAVAGSSSSALFNASRRRSSLTPSLPNLAPPSNFNGSKRRSSLTPSLPTLAAPSPTRALVAGRLSARPPSSEGHYQPVHSRTMDSITGTTHHRRASAAAIISGSDTRRGSLPHLYYGAWTGPGTPTAPREPWNPALASLRGSVDDPIIDQSFKFGCPPAATTASLASSSTGSRTAESGDDPASGSAQRPATTSSSSKRKELSAFELAEQQEADRQRRAFLAATYGEDSRRARARLSLGGPLGASPGSPASTRRQSLLLWERIHKPPEAGGINQSSAAAFAAAAAATAVPAPMLHQTLEKELGRRPSLPINIPMRTPPAQTAESFDDQSIWDNPDGIDPNATPVRPLPPLLPLSDPVPRLLPSTLALHRATHLLNARGIASEPLPAPLPPSLHPPAPVDLSEFDIDFILAGSRSNLGRQGSTSSTKRPSGESFTRNGPLGGGGLGGSGGGVGGSEEEDSFAKFVGAFDDEYGGRRGEWTFRACAPSSLPTSPQDDSPALRDPTRPRPRAEWDSPGAGRYEIYPNGDVRSVETGAVWHMRKTSSREYEFEQPLRIPNHMLPTDQQSPGQDAPQPLIFAVCGGYTLASKLVHTENGGVKLPFAVHRELTAKGNRNSRVSRRIAAARHRQSLVQEAADPAAADQHRMKRVGSEDSGATAIPTTAIPINHHLSTVNNHHQLASSMPPSRIITSPISPSDDMHGHHHPSTPKEIKRLSRGRREKDSDDDKPLKKGSSLGGVLKRGLFRAHSLVKEYEERTKERHASNGGHGHGHGFGHAHGNNNHHSPLSAGATTAQRHSPARPSPIERPSDRSDTASASSQHSSGKYTNESADELADWPGDAPFGSLGLGIEDEQNGGQPWKEGKAWVGVPDEALAMVIPIESDSRTPHPPQSPAVTQPFINPFFVDGPRQALLVWFTPFNADTAPPERERESRVGSSSTLFKIAEAPHHEESPHGTSLRLPKLLRPRGHRPEGAVASPLAASKTIPIPPPMTTPPSDFDLHPIHEHSRRESRNFQPLPFKSFRVVAKVVDTEDLRSEPEVPVIALEQWTEQLRTGKPAGGLHTPPLDGQSRTGDDSLGVAPMFPGEPSRSPSIADSGVLSGRAFPTVIAVCHSQSSGVEFVLEGLDRLGLCKGGNAWGPTGYEEWRGTGLSDNGRQALDLLWTACSAVMGI